ncbi:aminotransferase-like domain-containing protein [Laceyella tengchongensis]
MLALLANMGCLSHCLFGYGLGMDSCRVKQRQRAIALLNQQGQSAPLIFVIPSHQFPMGGTLSIQRRVKLIEYARLHDSYIVEDDYDSEFCFEGTPVPSLQGMAPERVIYVGTFSKILSPAIRIGYLILPPPLVSQFRKHKWYLDRHSPLMDQMILSRFIQEGHLDRHIRNMKKVYHKKRNHLIKALTHHFPQVNILGRKAGMHLVAEFPGLPNPWNITPYKKAGTAIKSCWDSAGCPRRRSTRGSL